MPAKKKTTAKKPGFGPVFAKLRAILARHAKKLVVKADSPTSYGLDTRLTRAKKPVFFGAGRAGEAYVSHHLFPVHVFPDLLDGVSPALRRRVQGQSCFDLQELDPALADELATLTARGVLPLESRPLPAAGHA